MAFLQEIAEQQTLVGPALNNANIPQRQHLFNCCWYRLNLPFQRISHRLYSVMAFLQKIAGSWSRHYGEDISDLSADKENGVRPE